MDINTLITLISITVTILSIGYSVYKTHELNKVKNQLKRFNWSDIQNGIDSISYKVWNEFNPDLIFCISGPGSIIGYLISMQDKTNTPVILAPYHNTKLNIDKKYHFNQNFRSSKFTVYIPNDLIKYKNKKVLIVDDTVITGDLNTNAKNYLIKIGFNHEMIKSCSLFVSETSIHSNKGSDYYWMTMDNDEYYLPWGKSFGKGF